MVNPLGPNWVTKTRWIIITGESANPCKIVTSSPMLLLAGRVWLTLRNLYYQISAKWAFLISPVIMMTKMGTPWSWVVLEATSAKIKVLGFPKQIKHSQCP